MKRFSQFVASAGQFDEAIAQIEVMDKRYGYQENAIKHE